MAASTAAVRSLVHFPVRMASCIVFDPLLQSQHFSAHGALFVLSPSYGCKQGCSSATCTFKRLISSWASLEFTGSLNWAPKSDPARVFREIGLQSSMCPGRAESEKNSLAVLPRRRSGFISGGQDFPDFGRGFPNFGGNVRRFRAATPVCMGRRSSKIAMRKGAQDAKKSKLYGKIGKQIISAVKAGGPSPGSNPALALVLSQARLYDIPKDIVERNIKKASEKGQADFTQLNYEVYGVGGVGIVLDVLTDNNARAAATVRDVVKKGGGKMADPGSVLFNFSRCGVVAVPAQGLDADELLLAAMDAGADDVREPEDIPEDADEPEDQSPLLYRVVTPLEGYTAVRAKLEEAGLPIDNGNSGLELLPLAYVEPDDEARELNILMIEKLLELDDVDAVYSNQR